MQRAGRKIERWHSASGQTLLFNPQAVPDEVVEELSAVYGYNPKAAAGCLAGALALLSSSTSGTHSQEADIMISQTKNAFPPVAFMLVNKKNRHVAIEDLIDRVEKARKAFQHLYSIIIEQYPRLYELQVQLLRRGVCVKVISASTASSAAKLMVSVREKHSYQLTQRSQALHAQLNEDLQTRDRALQVLSSNMRFLTQDDCEMLLDVFGSLSRIILATKVDILDNTVLNEEAAHAIEEFFRTEYTVE